MPERTQDIATLGGGCFWCTEAVFEQLEGVDSVVPGYCGGESGQPSYRSVCSGTTGHAEVVRVVFDPAVISYAQVLEVFFATHDPTTRDRQGNDVGTQYRSVIFCHSAAQRAVAETLIRQLENERRWAAPLTTEVRSEAPFFAAEDEHRHYFANNPEQAYCQFIVAPKVAKFRHGTSLRLKASGSSFTA